MPATRRKEPTAYVEQSRFAPVSLHLADRGAVFVVLRNAMAPTCAAVTMLTSMAGLWTISSPANRRCAQAAT